MNFNKSDTLAVAAVVVLITGSHIFVNQAFVYEVLT